LRKSGLLLEACALPALFFISIWIALPAAENDTWGWALGVILLAGTGWLLWRSRPHWPPPCDRYWFSKKDAPADLAVLLLPLLAGWWLAESNVPPAEAGRIVKSLLLYPLYALLQLAVFLAIPATRLKAAGARPLAVTATCAVVFALAHAPNPLLMLVTGLAMLAWAGQFLRGRSLVALALIMGIAATGFRYAVPAQYHADLRIGPDYVEKRLEISGR